MAYFFLRVKAVSFLFIMGFTQWNTCLGGPNKYAAIVIDGSTGRVLHAENAYERRHPASLTKKMSLYLIFEALQSGKVTLNTRFPVSFLATRQISSRLGLCAGDSISVESIIKALVIKSANDAAVVLAEGLAGSLDKFVQTMNKKAKQLGMHSTRFYNPSGVPDRRQITTAMDMAILAQALYQDFPQYYHYFQIKSFNYLGQSHRNHNHMLGKIQGLDGIKTGFTCASGFNISTSAIRYDAQNKPRRLFAVVMGGNSGHSRDKRAAELLEVNFRKIGAISAKTPKFLPAPGTKGVMIKKTKEKEKRTNIESIELINSNLSEKILSKDASLLETSRRQNAGLSQQQSTFQDKERIETPPAIRQPQAMQAVSYAPHPSEVSSYAQLNLQIPEQFPVPTLRYSNPSCSAHPQQIPSPAHTHPSEQILKYLQSTESSQVSKATKPALGKTAKQENHAPNSPPPAPVNRILPARWITPKPPTYKEISLSPIKKVAVFKKEKILPKKIKKKRRSARKKTI